MLCSVLDGSRKTAARPIADGCAFSDSLSAKRDTTTGAPKNGHEVGAPVVGRIGTSQASKSVTSPDLLWSCVAALPPQHISIGLPTLFCRSILFSWSDIVSPRLSGPDLGHGRSGTFPFAGTDVLPQCAGGSRSIRCHQGGMLHSGSGKITCLRWRHLQFDRPLWTRRNPGSKSCNAKQTPTLSLHWPETS